MILLHLFYSAVPRAFDTPRVRLLARAACVMLLALVLTTAMTRGEEPAATQPAEVPAAEAHEGRGNVSIIHVPEPAAPAWAVPVAPPTVASTESTHAAEPEAASESHDQPAPTATVAEAAHLPEAQAAPSDSQVTHAPEPPPEAAVAHAPEQTHPAVVEATPADSHASATPHGPEAVATKPARAANALSAVGDYAAPDAVDAAAESARRFWQAGDHAAAEKAFTRALTANVRVERKRSLVLEMAGLYRGAGQLTKAAAVLEKFIKTYPDDREVPQVLLRLGTIYRELGVYSMATARFFQVLNSTLRVSDEDIPEYRQLAMKARLEIAETYAVQGNLTEAEKYFSRLRLLDLEPADRERVLLRAAQMQFTLKQWLAAEKALAAFAAGSPESPHLAEVRYMRAKSLEELGRKQEAVDEVVALLQLPLSGDPESARNTAYWKRRCANELANNFYEQGDFLGALAVYQALARASIDPTWRWPAIYQIGLCFERMDMPQRAAEAYDAILTPETAPAPGTKLPESLVSLQDMAKWRRSHLVWIEDKGKQLQSLAAE